LVSIGVQFDQEGRAVPAKPENVLMGAVPTPVEPPAPRGGSTQPKPVAPAAGSIPAPTTKAEYDAIPKGTRYRDTDGLEKIKG